MPIRAKISPGYTWRLAAMAGLVWFFVAWFIYDGSYAWPKENERRWAYARLQASGEPDWTDRWREMAREQGWSSKQPDAPRSDWYTYDEAGNATPKPFWQGLRSDIGMQYVYAAIAFPFGVFFLAKYVSYLGRWMEVDDDGIKTSWGQRVPFEQITEIDKKRWRKKGIAVVHYEDEKGNRRKVTIDDWKYDREPSGHILREVEERTGLGGGDDVDADIEASSGTVAAAKSETESTPA